MCDIEDNFEFDYVDSEYNPYTMPSYAVEPEAIKEIRSKRVPSEIINSAITIFYTLENPNGKTQKVFKKEKRDRRIFVCIYSAYNMEGLPMDPKHLALMIGMNIHIDKAFNENMFKIEIDPILLSKFYLRRLNEVKKDIELNVDGIIEEVKRIYDICNETEEGHDYLVNSPVKSISIGILYFYLYIHDFADIYKDYLKDAWYLSFNCIKKYYVSISNLYNTFHFTCNLHIHYLYLNL